MGDVQGERRELVCKGRAAYTRREFIVEVYACEFCDSESFWLQRNCSEEERNEDENNESDIECI